MKIPDITALRSKVSNGILKSETLPTRIKVLAWGENEATKGEKFRVGEGTMKALAANQRPLGFERVAIDYDHCTVPGSSEYVKGQPKAIFGYGRPAVVPNDGLYLEEIQWTPLGAQHAKNYEDLSPAVHSEDGEVDFVHSVALTPNGRLHDVTLFSAGSWIGQNGQNGEKTNMPEKFLSLAVLSAALSLKAEATEQEVTDKLKKLSALEPLEGLIKDGKVIVLATPEDVTAVSDRVKKIEEAGNKAIATLSATIDGKVQTLTVEDLVKLSSRIEGLETLLNQQKEAAGNAEKTQILTLLSTEGKAPKNPETGKPYTAEELRSLDPKMLRALHANTPSTVPLSARNRNVQDGKAIDPNLKGRARFVAAQELVNGN